MLDILVTIPGKKRHTPSGWWSFNAICCHHRGHKADRRGRGGVIFTAENSWSYSCFNCGFKCGASPGKHYGKNTKMLLKWCGLDERDIDLHSFQCFSARISDTPYDGHEQPIDFEVRSLPEGAVPLDWNNPQHGVHVQYLRTRGLTGKDYTYYITPDSQIERDLARIIVPYYWDGKIVGYTSRYYDGRKPKYISEQQRGYVFNVDRQRRSWSVCLLVEGQFDAISIDGCAYLGSTISDEQAKILSGMGKRIIVVPDQDKTGMTICDRALELGYSVSIPGWGDGVKDTNDAVRRYGKLATIASILEASTQSKITVEMHRRRFK